MKGCTQQQRSLTTEVEIRFAFVLILACLISAFTTTILEKSTVEVIVSDMNSATKASELQSINVRLDKLSKSAASVFVQASNECSFQANYATKVLSGANKNYASAYPSYKYTSAPPSGAEKTSGPDQYGITYYTSYQTSGWWNKMNDDVTKELYMPAANVLDNQFISLYKSNPNYGEVYMGFESGMMKKYPWYTAAVPAHSGPYTPANPCIINNKLYKQGYVCMQYECKNPSNLNTVVGYDPRCRGWYNEAKESPGKVIFSAPYVGASKGWSMITVAKTVTLDGVMRGVVGIDIYTQTLKTTILGAKILEDGYTYLIDKQLNIIMHPNAISTSVLYTVQGLEFKNVQNIMITTLQADIAAGKGGKLEFNKANVDWYGSWQPVENTDYYMVMVVPMNNILKASIDIAASGDHAIKLLTGWVIGIGIASFLAGIAASRSISKKIADPVAKFSDVIRSINKNNIQGDVKLELHSDFKQINKLQSKILSLFLAVKFSTGAYHEQKFEAARKYLEAVEQMFADQKQLHALGVVFNNKAEILRAAACKVKELKAGETFSDSMEVLYKDSIHSFRLAVANARFLFRAATARLEEAINDPKGDNNTEVAAAQKEQMVYMKRLGDRLSNMAVGLKSAGQVEEALEVTREAFEILMACDDIIGIIRVTGNRGLFWIDFGQFALADAEFKEAYRMAYEAFQREPTPITVSAFQLACCNMGRYLKEMLASNCPSDAGAKSLMVNDALKFFYYAITISNRIPGHVLRRCVLGVDDLYKLYFTQSNVSNARDKLCEMFPAILQVISRPNIGILVDVSPSMNHRGRINSATSTLNDIIDNQVLDGDYLRVNCFACAHDTVVRPSIVSPANRVEIRNNILSLNHRCVTGYTYFYKALLELGQRMSKAKVSESSKTIVFALTDGEDNERITKIPTVKIFYKTHNITLMIICIGVSEYTQRTLRKLVEEDEYVIAAGNDMASISNAMKQGFAIAQSDGAIVMEAL